VTFLSNKLAAAAQAAVDLTDAQALRRDGAAFKFQWRDAINTDHTLTERQRRVALDIARRVNSTTLTTSWISDAEIADFLKMHRVDVCKARTVLQETGWINRKAGRFKSRYTLTSVNIDRVMQAAEDRERFGRELRGRHAKFSKRRTLTHVIEMEGTESQHPIQPLIDDYGEMILDGFPLEEPS
jgi:hypothetical protein